MTPAVPTRAARKAAEDVDQGAFDFLIPYSEKRKLLHPREAALCFHRSVDFIYTLIDEGRLEAHAPQDREKARYMITRRSVLLVLAEQANYDPAYFMERLKAAHKALTAEQLSELIVHLTSLRSRL